MFIAFAVAVALLSLTPGPDMMFIVANAIGGGKRAGIVAALGVSTGLAVHTVAAAFGVGQLLRAAPGALDVVRLLGALFLVYLAVSAWRSSRQHGELAVAQVGRRSTRKVFAMAVLTNVANPKVALFYLAFFPQFVTTGAGSWPVMTQVFTLGGLFIVIGLAVDGSAGVVAGGLSEKVFGNPRVRRLMDRVSAAIFGGLAVRLALDVR